MTDAEWCCLKKADIPIDGGPNSQPPENSPRAPFLAVECSFAISDSDHSLCGRPPHQCGARQRVIEEQQCVDADAQARIDKSEKEGNSVEHRYEPPVPAQRIEAMRVGARVHQSGAERVRPYGVEKQAGTTERAAIKQRGKREVGFSAVGVFGEKRGRERQDGRRKQQKQIADEKNVVTAADMMKHHVVVGPDHADLQKAHDISEIRRPLLQQRAC